MSSARLARVAELLAAGYDLKGDLTRLTGENENYEVLAEGGSRYVLKVAAANVTTEVLDLEHQAVEAVHAAKLGLGLPRMVPARDGGIETAHAPTGEAPLRARLLRFVPGIPWCEAGMAAPAQLRDLGRTVAAIDTALANVTLPSTGRTHRWDLAAAAQHRGEVGLIDDPKRRRILEAAFHLYASCAVPALPHLPHSLIHGDVNDENVLVRHGCVSGLLDFGDCLYNPTICELAIALAYSMLDQEHPLAAGREVVAGYHAKRPLSEGELGILFPLVCGRLSVTVTVAAARRRIDPEREDWFVTEYRAWDLLTRFSEVDPAEAGTRLSAGTEKNPFEDRGEPAERLRVRRLHSLGAALSIAYRKPLKIVLGAGQYLHDDRGRPFLDLVNNVCHVGHCHPRVVEAGQRQMARLNTNTRYLHDGIIEYAERLAATLPARLDTCFFVNSGSEANELALRLAETHTERRDVIVQEGAYHGHTGRLIDISPYKFMGPGGSGKPEPWVHIVPMPDSYRGKHRGSTRESGVAYGNEIGVAYGDEIGSLIAAMDAPMGAFIAESLSSCGGQILPPAGYFQTAFEHVRSAGGLCIADEVQVGFGRVGTHFWAFEAQGVVPDIVVLGKPIGNGHPIGAVVTTTEIAASFDNGMEFFSTFGGNPVSAAIGLAVLDVIQGEGLQERSLELGGRFLEGLGELKDKHELVGDVRGAGLFIGVELVRDRDTLEPATEEADQLINRLQERGLLLSTDGPLHNVIKIKPPMVLTADDVDMAVRMFDDELANL